jgi:adenylate kinase family enzyme
MWKGCQATLIRNCTGCVHFSSDARLRLNQLVKAERLLKEIAGQETGHRRKNRGVFNFVGDLSKVLFGTMDDDDAKYYNDQIKLFEQNSEHMSTLLRATASSKNIIGSGNNTLADEYTENLLKGLTRLLSIWRCWGRKRTRR